MDRRRFLKLVRNSAGCTLPAVLLGATGCAGRQYGHLLSQQDTDMVGSHQAGAAVWNPLVDESVAKLLGRCDAAVVHPAAYEDPMANAPYGPNELPTPPATSHPAKVCFIALENKSAEEMADFKEQLYQRIDSQVNSSGNYRMVSRRMIDEAMLATGTRPDSIYLPDKRRLLAAVLESKGSAVDYFLYGTITSGTTERNNSTQRDYELTLEMVSVHTGDYVKETATIRKGYHKSRVGKWWNYGLFQQADG